MSDIQQFLAVDIAESGKEKAERTEELTAKLDQLRASATQQYSLKNYNAAAEFYSEAAEVQDELNGEMSPENADLLYQYGRCLYHVAVSKSDVLGGKVAGEEPQRKKRKPNTKAESSKDAAAAAAAGPGSSIEDALKSGQEKLAEDVVEAAVEEKDGVKIEEQPIAKPFFQITGDENWTDSEDSGDEAEAEAEEEEDDFAIAYEILDVARVLLTRKLEASQAASGKSTKESPESRHLRERLADTHDLQAEISLENERFHDAITDTKAALELKLHLYPLESSLVAEAHYKLSLALEFASVTSNGAEAPGDDEAAAAEPSTKEEPSTQQVDESLRAEAATEMEKAIASCEARIAKETASLSDLAGNAQQSTERKKSIQDVKEMVADMQQRLVDLQNPAVSLSAGEQEGGDALEGVLGAMLGESKEGRAKRVKEATEGANDLTGLVKHRKKKGSEEEGKGKRKAEDDRAEGDKGKKARVEEA
ncbi:hypothetical protein MBLNU230_g8153t1 [Neophaeotheca triangularis]